MSLSDIEQAFVNTWSPYASQVGQSLGVDPNIVLSQWALESGWGSNPGAAGNNVAGIGGASNPAVYSSPAAFANSFTQLVQNTYNGATGVGSDITSYVNGLGSGGSSGNLSYFGSQTPSSYLSALSPVYQQISAANPNSSSSSLPSWLYTNNFQGPGDTLTGGPVQGGPGSTLWNLVVSTVFGNSFVLRVGVAIIAFILIVVGFAALALKSEPGEVVASAVKKVVP